MKSAALIFCALVIAAGVAVPLEEWLIQSREEPPTNSAFSIDLTRDDPTGATKKYRNAPAADFTLRLLDGGNLHLADLIGPRPVVLVFGTFDCVYLCQRVEYLRKLHAKYADRAAFLFVYLRDDPHTFWEHGDSSDEGIRAKMKQYRLNMPCVVATDEDHVGNVYDAYPGRMYIVDRSGRIAFDSNYVHLKGLDTDRADAWLAQHCPTAEESRAKIADAGPAIDGSDSRPPRGVH